jgi:hypothetical protein
VCARELERSVRLAARHRPSLEGLAACLAVSVPALAIEENWHGRPMIDQPGHLFVVPLVVTAAGFLVGGAIAGRRRPRLPAALCNGAGVGLVASAVLTVADVLRRLGHHERLSAPVGRLWLETAALATVLAALGGALAQQWSPNRATPPLS